MYIYFIFLLIPYFFLYIKKDSNLHNTSIFPITYLTVLFIFLGLRLEFGTDWHEYSKDYFQTVSFYQNSNFIDFLGIRFVQDFNVVNLIGDMPIYNLSLILSYYVSDNIIFFNLLNSFIAVFGIFFYCKILNISNEKFWPIICFIFPFFIFISTDIIRQFTSLIFILISISFFLKSKFKNCIIFLTIATLVHISAMIFFAILLFIKSKYRIGIIIFFIYMVSHFYFFNIDFFLIDLISFYMSPDRLSSYKINFNYLLILFPAFVLTVIYYKHLFSKIERKLIIFFILYGLLCFHFSLLDDTVSYRLSIYLLIFYIFALTTFIRRFKGKKLFWFKQALMSFGAIITLIWLTFSEHKHVYVPYNNVLFLDQEFKNTKSQLCAKYQEVCDFKQR